MVLVVGLKPVGVLKETAFELGLETVEGLLVEELEGPHAVSDEVAAELVGERLELEFGSDPGADLGSDSEDPVRLGAGEGEGGELVRKDPFGGGGAAADVEVELDGARTRVRV